MARLLGTTYRVITAAEMRRLLKQKCEEAGSQVAFAKIAGVPKQHINNVLKGTRDPWPALLKALGLKEEKQYLQKV